MHVCDTTYIPSIHLYAYIYIYIYTQIDCIHTYSSCIMRTRAHSAKCYQRLIYRYLSLYRYTQKQVCFSPKGIQIYAASSHYHQMRRKGLWQHPPPCHVHSYMQTHEKGNALGHGHTEREGRVQKLQGLICNCFKKKNQNITIKMSVQYWKLCSSKQIFKATGISITRSETVWANNS